MCKTGGSGCVIMQGSVEKTLITMTPCRNHSGLTTDVHVSDCSLGGISMQLGCKRSILLIAKRRVLVARSSDAWVENLTEGTAQCTADPVQATARNWAQVNYKNKNGSEGRWGIIAHSKEWDSRIKGNGRRGLMMPLILLRQTSAWRVKKTSEHSHRKSIISGLNNAKYTNAHSCTWRI